MNKRQEKKLKKELLKWANKNRHDWLPKLNRVILTDPSKIPIEIN